MEGQRAPEILDYRNKNGHGWSFYKNDGVLRMVNAVTSPEDDMAIIRKIQQFEFRDDDTLIVAYAKCGTHWLWEIATMLRAGNSEYNKKTKRFAMLGGWNYEGVDELPSPRVLNSHLYFRQLPKTMVEKKIKTIFIMRNPKDVCVSSYFMASGVNKFAFDGTCSEYLDLFLEGKVAGGAYTDYVKDWLQVKQDHPDLPVLTLFYENLKKDPVTNIRKVADFMGASVSDELCQQIAEACSFKNMRTADAEMKEQAVQASELWKKGEQKVYRKGETGDWKNWITVAQNERFDDVLERTLGDTGIVFTYD